MKGKIAAFLSKFGAVIAAGLFGALLVNAGPSVSSAISLLTGPQPAADLVSIVNNLINSINNQVGPAGAGAVKDSVYVPACSSANNCTNLVSLSGGVSSSAAASNQATIASYGPAASVSLNISPQGVNGLVRFGNPSNILALGTVQVSAPGNVGPAGFGSPLQTREWLIIQDSSGVSRLIQLWGPT